jgi:cytosine/adenosine deaminase-related metal-dependent hydrolase
MALYRGALAGGAQALGADCGIAPGHAADLITLAADHPGLAARVGEALVDGWIFAAGRGAIDTVWRQGAKVVSGGRHHAREAVAARFRSCLARLL